MNIFRKIHHHIVYLFKYKRKFKKQYGDNMPWAVVIDIRSKRKIRRDEERYNVFLERACEIITPNKKTINELVEHLEQKYDAERYEISERDYSLFMINLLHNEYSHLFEENAQNNITIRDLRRFQYINTDKYVKIEHDPLDKIEDLEIKPMYYRLKNINKTDDLNVRYVDIAIDGVTGFFWTSGGSGEIGRDIILFLGVSEEDIERKSEAFQRYAVYLRNIGKIGY